MVVDMEYGHDSSHGWHRGPSNIEIFLTLCLSRWEIWQVYTASPKNPKLEFLLFFLRALRQVPSVRLPSLRRPTESQKERNYDVVKKTPAQFLFASIPFRKKTCKTSDD